MNDEIDILRNEIDRLKKCLMEILHGLERGEVGGDLFEYSSSLEAHE